MSAPVIVLYMVSIVLFVLAGIGLPPRWPHETLSWLGWIGLAVFVFTNVLMPEIESAIVIV